LNDESSLKSSKEKEYENHYQDRPQNATRGIAPTLAMRPGRKGADEKEDEYDNYNSAEHGISPLWFVVSLTYAAALAYICPNLVLGTSFTKFNPAPDTLAVGSGMDNMG